MLSFSSNASQECVTTSLIAEVEVEVNLRPTVSWPLCLGIRHPSGTRYQFLFLLEIFFRQLRVCYVVAPSLTRGRVCNLLYNCFRVLPEQSLLGRSPAELTAIFYCLTVTTSMIVNKHNLSFDLLNSNLHWNIFLLARKALFFAFILSLTSSNNRT
jgi:hypothetical protein